MLLLQVSYRVISASRHLQNPLLARTPSRNPRSSTRHVTLQGPISSNR
jgi:hypothetical protein